jgi:hypothetical protein
MKTLIHLKKADTSQEIWEQFFSNIHGETTVTAPSRLYSPWKHSLIPAAGV